MDGAYSYYSQVTDTKADTLLINMNGSNATLLCYGFVVKYLMKIRENYFGESAKFQTLEEFANKEVKPVEYVRHRVCVYIYIKSANYN